MNERVFLSNNQGGIIEHYGMMHFLNVTDVLTNRVNCSGSTFNLTLFWRGVRDLRALLLYLFLLRTRMFAQNTGGKLLIVWYQYDLNKYFRGFVRQIIRRSVLQFEYRGNDDDVTMTGSVSCVVASAWRSGVAALRWSFGSPRNDLRWWKRC